MTKSKLFCLFTILGLVLAGWSNVSFGGEEKRTYKNVRIPRYKNDILINEIVAEVADERSPTPERPKVNMTGVTIYVYGKMPPGISPNADVAPPIKMKITSKLGVVEMVRHSDGRNDSIARLNKDVKVECYKYPKGSLDKSKRKLTTTVLCDNATWDNSRQVLQSKGDVRIIQPRSTLVGTDMKYVMTENDGEGINGGAIIDNDEGDEGDIGGVFILYHNVRMDINGSVKESDPKSKPIKTVITCRGIGSYNLDKREAQFQKEVKVKRPDMDMDSDNLRIILTEKSQRIRDLIAWGNVVIRGMTMEGEERKISYIAYGDDARYNEATSRTVLRDTRKDRLPRAVIDDNRISDDILYFYQKEGELDTLVTKGGKGNAVFLIPQKDPSGKTIPGKFDRTNVTYKESLVYKKAANQAVFTGDVVLRTDKGMTVNSRELTVITRNGTDEENKKAGAASGIERMIAVGKVVITQPGTRATSERAELTASNNLLILSGQPHPQIETVESRLTSPIIEMLLGDNDLKILKGMGGPGTFVSLRTKQTANGSDDNSPAVARKVTSEGAIIIRYDKSMYMDNRKSDSQYVEFTKNVVATSEDYVLRSNKLEAFLTKTPSTINGKKTIKYELTKIISIGDATMHSGMRHSKGERIERYVQEEKAILYGIKGVNAEVWEENGVRFDAPVIVALQKQNAIQASGPGKAMIPDGALKGDSENGKVNAVVAYAKHAYYIETPNNTGKVVFVGDVVMTRMTDGMVINGSKMTAFLEEREDIAPVASADGKKRVPRTMRRCLVEDDVVVTQGKRVAKGTVGELMVRTTGDVITLTGVNNKPAEVNDNDGVRLYAPRVQVFQATDVVTAGGPGRVIVTSSEPLKYVGRGDRRQEGQGRKSVFYTIDYDGEFRYNSLARKIRIIDNVRIFNDALRGMCHQMSILLVEDTSATPGAESETRFKVKHMDAEGKVQFYRYPKVRFDSDRNKAPEDRVGKSIIIRGKQCHYDIASQMMKVTGGYPYPEVRQMITEINNIGDRTYSQTKGRAEEWLTLDIIDGQLDGQPRIKMEYVPSSEPFKFDPNW